MENYYQKEMETSQSINVTLRRVHGTTAAMETQ